MDLPHTALLERVTDALAARFPAAGIAVTGSVAAGTHHTGSDLDLLVVDTTVARDWQMAFPAEGVRVNVVCVHPERFGAQMRADAAAFAAVRASYVISARTLRDPAGHLDTLRDHARRAVELRRTNRDELFAVHAAAARARLARSEGGLDAWAAAALVAAIEGALLRAGRTALSKADGSRPMVALASEDPALHARIAALLAGAVPVSEAVEDIISLVFSDGKGSD
jgi:hypothetical protein